MDAKAFSAPVSIIPSSKIIPFKNKKSDTRGHGALFDFTL
jgi:hypothetical protein